MKNENEAAHNGMKLVMHREVPIADEKFNSLWMDASGKFYFARVGKQLDPQDLPLEAFHETDFLTAVEWSLHVDEWADAELASFKGSHAPLLRAAMAKLQNLEADKSLRCEKRARGSK